MLHNYRRWWHKPQLHQEGEDARRVTFLELFFDLIFVVVIARLAHHLTEHPDWASLRDFVDKSLVDFSSSASRLASSLSACLMSLFLPVAGGSKA